MVEGGAGGSLDLDQPLSQSGALHLQRAVVAIGVVAGLAQDDVRRPRAARAADVRVVASAAEAPEIVDGSIAREAQLARCPPVLFYSLFAGVAARVARRRQGSA